MKTLIIILLALLLAVACDDKPKNNDQTDNIITDTTGTGGDEDTVTTDLLQPETEEAKPDEAKDTYSDPDTDTTPQQDIQPDGDNISNNNRITKQWGTSHGDSGNSVAIDASGNIYVTGTTNGALDGNTYAGSGDIFLTKWNSSGVKQWTKQWGTSSDDWGHSVAVDTNGNIYVTGTTFDALDGNTYAGSGDIFLTKWNSSGVKQWTKQWGTSGNGTLGHDSGSSVAIDPSGNIYVTGTTFGALDGNPKAGDYADIFLTKWNSSGEKQWTRQWGSPSHDWGRSVAVDASGNIYVTGWTADALDGNTNAGGDCDPTTVGEQPCSDIFLTKWNPDGTKAWTKQWGTSDSDSGNSVAVDASGNIYVTGTTEGALDGNIYAGSVDIFLTKWNSSGVKQWTKQWGTSNRDYGNSVAVDASGNSYVTGSTNGALDDNTSAGDPDIFLTKWNSSGEKQWIKQWGTSNGDTGHSVAVDTSGTIYITGSTDGELDGNTNAGYVDIFLSIINEE